MIYDFWSGEKLSQSHDLERLIRQKVVKISPPLERYWCINTFSSWVPSSHFSGMLIQCSKSYSSFEVHLKCMKYFQVMSPQRNTLLSFQTFFSINCLSHQWDIQFAIALLYIIVINYRLMGFWCMLFDCLIRL